MAQDSPVGERKARPKRRTGTPAKPPASVRGQASETKLTHEHLNLDFVMRGISARGSGTIVEIEHFPHLQSSQDLKMVYSQVHPLGYDKLVLATSSMTPIAAGNPDEYVIDLRGALYGGAGDHVLDGGLGSDFIDLRESAPSDAELEQEAGELLKAARDAEGAPSLRSARRRFEEYVFSGAVDALGGAQAIGMAVRDEADLLRAIGLGFPVLVLTSLRQAGFRSDDLEGVIAPKRTLARRKAGGQRLTRVESDAAWRLAHVFSLGGRVLRGPEAAVAWLRRPKAALGDRTPVDLIETAVGAQAVERLLFQLEWGDIA